MAEGRRVKAYKIEDLMEKLGILITVPEELPEPPRHPAEPEPTAGPGREGGVEETIEIEIPSISGEEPEAAGEGEGEAREAGRSLGRLEVLITKMIGELRERYGDIMLYSDFLAAIEEAYTGKYGEEVFLWEIEEVVKRLIKDKIIAGTFILSSGAKIIRLSPEGFGKDELKVLELASRRTPPELTKEELAMEMKWPIEKAKAILEALEKAGIARRIPGSYEGEQERWYFPGLERKTE